MTSPYEADPDKIPAADLYADVPCYGRYCPKPDDFHVDHQHVNSQGPESLTYWASVIDICTEENRIYPADAGDRDVFALGSTIVKSSHLHATGDTQSPEIDFSYADANEIKAITLAKTVLSDIKVPEIYFAGKIHGRQVLVQERLPGVGLSVAWPYLSREQKKSYKEQARKTLHQLHTVKPAQRLKARSHVVMDPNILSNGRINPLEGAIIFSVANHDPDISFMHNDFTVSNCIVNNDAIVGLIDIQFFWEEYRRFWAQPQSTSTHFLMKLVLILALGTTFYPDRSNRMHLRRLAHTWIYAVQWWLVGPSEKSAVNLDGLQVGCLLLLARQTNSLPGTSWLSAGSVLRMAMAMGLHRSPELFPVLSVYQSEMRARLWATVLELTLLSMLDAAMPLPFSLQDIDCTAPSNLDDEQFGPETEMLPTPQSSKRLTDSSIQVLLFKSLPVRVEVVWLLNNQHHQELSYETALRLGNELRSACRDLASFFGTSRNQSRHAGRTPGMTNFHLRFLDTYLRRYILFLYRPFMIQARKDPRFYLSRKLCLESCIVVASYADHLNLPSDALDDLSHLTIVGRGSFKGALSFDVITSLGLEIITQLEEEASTRPLGSSPPFVADSLDELAKAHRAPLIRSLEHIQEQLLQIIALGNPSLKRYNFLSAILSQIRAMESGQPTQPAIYETIKESLKNCYVLLEASHTASSPQDSVESLTTGPDSLPGFDLDALDPALGLEIPSLLFFPGVMGTSSIEWSGIDVNKQPWNATTEP